MRRGSSIPLEERERIVELYTQYGKTMEEIAKITFWSQTAVHRALHQSGCRIRKRGWNDKSKRLDPEKLLETAELYGKGLTGHEIAELLGIHPSTVYSRLHSADILIRPRRGGRGRRRKAPALAGESGASRADVAGGVDAPGPSDHPRT